MSSSPTGDKTEKPTAKRLKDAREKGQTPRSRELVAARSLIAATLALWRLGPSLITGIAAQLSEGLVRAGEQSHATLSSIYVTGLVWSHGRTLALLVGPLALTAVVATVASNIAQGGWVFAPKAIHLNWSRLSPSSGLSRLKPSQSGFELLRTMAGAVVLGVLGYGIGRALFAQVPSMVAMSPGQAARLAWDQLWGLLWRSGLALVVLGSFDYALQRWRAMNQLKMTKQEVRDESKMHEGNPEIKNRVRRVQRDMMRQRMLAAVKKATVVVVNPTHYAVALEYRRETMAAPVIVAKGQDSMALRIRTIARESGVPIIENPVLARALHAGGDVGDAIPAALFSAVAEILAYLVRIKQLLL